MAIPPIELRYRKSMAYFILVVSGFLSLTVPVTILSSGGTKASPLVYVTCFASIIILVFIGLRFYRKATSGEPVVIFTSEGLQISLKNNRFIKWTAITEWRIRRYKSSHALIIYTPEGKTRIDITWLDMSWKEIERLVEQYSRQPRAHGFFR